MKIDYGFIFQWIFVTFIGFLVSLYWVEIGEQADIWIIESAVGGAVIGSAQWFAIAKRISQAGWWILACVVGWVLLGSSGIGAFGWVAPNTSYIPFRIAAGIVGGIQVGIVLGIAQWFVLRTQFSQAWQWVVASCGGWAAGLACAWGIGGILRGVTRLFLGDVVGLVLGWMVVAAITGLALCLFEEL
ncbi:MAG TPA: hypothetical protein V6D33_10295 [Cyanophyceae cyanobacterium]